MTSWVATAYLSLRMGSIDWRSCVPRWRETSETAYHLHCGAPALSKHGPSLKFPTSPPPPPYVREVKKEIWPLLFIYLDATCFSCIEMLSCSVPVVGRQPSLCYQSISETTYCVNSRNNLLAAGGLSSCSNRDHQRIRVSTSCGNLVMISLWFSAGNSVYDDISLHARASDNSAWRARPKVTAAVKVGITSGKTSVVYFITMQYWQIDCDTLQYILYTTG